MGKPNIKKMKSKKDIQNLINMLRDKNYEIRRDVAEILGEIGDPRAVEPLIQAYKVEEMINARSTMIVALKKIKSPNSVEPLIRILKNGNIFQKQDAIKILGEIGDARALSPLIQALKDDNIYVRAAAAEVLGEIGDVRALKPLIKALKNETWIYTQPTFKNAINKIKQANRAFD